MKKAKKTAARVDDLQWFKHTKNRSDTMFAIWFGNEIVGWEKLEGDARIRCEYGNAELSRLVANRDARRAKKRGK